MTLTSTAVTAIMITVVIIRTKQQRGALVAVRAFEPSVGGAVQLGHHVVCPLIATLEK